MADCPEPRTAFDGSHRRRIYLFRHGDVSYVADGGGIVKDPRAVHLTEKGQAEADAMGAMMAEVPVDRAVCSGLPRTIQTAERILKSHGLDIEHVMAFEELRSAQAMAALEKGEHADPAPIPNLEEVAYAFRQAHEPGMRYRGGESFEEFQTRIVPALEKLLAEPGWHDMALVAHGGTNRIVLGWALDTGLSTFGHFEQDTCCVNVIDVDQDPETLTIRRKMVRAVNVTTYDPPKRDKNLTTLEALADRLRQAGML